MTRWARWQVYLFWASMAITLGAVLATVTAEASAGEWHHVWFAVPALLLLPFSAFLYAQRAKTLASLHEGETRFRLLMEEASDAIIVTDLEGRILTANKRAIDATGYRRGELLEMRVHELLEAGEEIDEDEVAEILARGDRIRLEKKIVLKDGRVLPVEATGTIVGGRYIQAIVRPIDERKAMEDTLRRSEQVFRAVSEMTSDYAYSMRVEPDGSLSPEWLTGAYEVVTGYTPAESHLRGGWQALVHPEDEPRLARELVHSLEHGGPAVAEFRIITKSGSIRHLKAWSRFERTDPDGPIDRIIGAVSDITAQKLLEQELRESERRFGDLYTELPVGVFRRSWDGVGLEANPAMVQMTRYPDREAFLRADGLDFWADPSDRGKWLQELESKGVLSNYVSHFKRYDGTRFWARMTARVVRDGSGAPAYIEGVVVDISEEVALDQELRATLRDLRKADAERKLLLTHLVKAKEEERNRVASDIHDDSVQVMTAIAIELERLARKVADPALAKSLEVLEARARDAVSRLRTMVFELRPPTLDQEGLASALRLYLEEFALDTGIDYELKNELDEEPMSPTRVVLYRIAQEALTNVRKHSNADCVRIRLEWRDGGVAMGIVDDGVGFDTNADRETPGHIGLSEMRERAEIGGGRFEIRSSPGAGTTVDVWVPELTR